MTLISLPLTNGGPSYTCERLVDTMTTEGINSTLITPADRRDRVKSDVSVRAVMPRWARKWPFTMTSTITQRAAEAILLQQCRTTEGRRAAYLWGNVSPNLGDRVRDTGTFVAREKFNCAMLVAREIVRGAYAKLDALAAFPTDTYDDRLIHAEMASLRQSDLIYCPSPMVAASLDEIGIGRAHMAATSYGFDAARLAGDHRALPQVDGPTYIFVGYICVRKGAHILLEAWRRSGVKGRLVLLGKIEPLIAERFADVLARPDVEHHAFTSDVGSYYRSADYFIFPTLEEGGPQVTYEAAACGVPAIVSAMGAGAIVRDGYNGRIVPNDDADSWAEAIAEAERQGRPTPEQAQLVRDHAMQFTWERVGEQRRQQLLERL